MPSSGSVSRSRPRGRPMASRSFDGKVALLFREGHEWTNTLWRHLADSGGEPGGGEKKRKRNGRCAIPLTEGIEKNTTFPTGPRGLRRVDWGAGNQRGSGAAAELGFPGCLASGGCARTSGAGAVARLVPALRQDSISQGPAAGVSGGQAHASHGARWPRRPPRLLGPLGLRLSSPCRLRRLLALRPPARSTWRRCCSKSWSARSWTSCLSPSRTNLKSSLLTSNPRSMAWRGGMRNLRWRVVSGDALPALDSGPDSVAMAGLLPLQARFLPATTLVTSVSRLLRPPRPALTCSHSLKWRSPFVCFKPNLHLVPFSL